MTYLQDIDEDDIEYYSELLIDEIEHGQTGMLIDNASKFINAFEKSKINFDCPIVYGYINSKFKKGILNNSESLCYYLL